MTMPEPIVYLNGRYLAKPDAAISVEERGMFFGDGVYEVLRFYGGRALAMEMHVERMRLSLSRIELAEPGGVERFPGVADALLEKNGLSDARVYWQITRGAAARSPFYPDVPPTELVLASAVPAHDVTAPAPTATAMFAPDERWSNCWIKSLMLLPNVLASNAARRAGYGTAILHRGDVVTEATNANVMIVRDGALWTHPADRWILDGVTRRLVLKCAERCGIPVREETYSTEQLLSADEVLLTGTTIHITAVTHVDGRAIGDAKVGAVTRRLHDAFNELIAESCYG